MKRLTKKFNGEYYCKDTNTIMFNSEIDYNVIQKLGRIEDLEEELGCPLEVVFEALNEGITVRNHEDLIEIGYSEREDKYVNFCTEEIYLKNWQSHGIEKTTNCFQITYGDDGEWCVYLEDYRKTWWLKKEKEDE